MGKLQFLKTDDDFAAFRQSKSFQTPAVKIRVRYRSDQNNPRFGFIVPKKVMPKVVDRNLIKRRLKSLLLQLEPRLKPADVVFYPQKELIRKKPAELSAVITQLFSQAKIWKS
ncbi:MAG: ribonuclease P protein component [Candidatus Doudnabacteria bacterium]|nr:ribonuclease P protein component [Candidatus Doudnabacteria bacterium]